MRPSTGTVNCWLIVLKLVEPLVGEDVRLRLFICVPYSMWYVSSEYVMIGTVNWMNTPLWAMISTVTASGTAGDWGPVRREMEKGRESRRERKDKK